MHVAKSRTPDVKKAQPDSKRCEVVKLFPGEDSRELLQRMLAELDSGALIGALVISFRPRTGESKRNFGLALSGVASTDPTIAAGALSACQVLVQELVLQDAGLL
jgi:hypothetical protein